MPDINFTMSDEDNKAKILNLLGKVYMGVPSDCWLKICIVSQRMDEKAFRENVLLHRNLDGLDGLAAGVSAIASMTVILVAVQMGYYHIAVMTAALAGGIIGFIRYNFNPATIFMGDTGSMFIVYIRAIFLPFIRSLKMQLILQKALLSRVQNGCIW